MTALKGHLVLLGQYTMSCSTWIQKHALQETALQIPHACALQGSLAVLHAQQLSQSASDMHASHAGFKTIFRCIITRSSIWVNNTDMSALQLSLALLHAQQRSRLTVIYACITCKALWVRNMTLSELQGSLQHHSQTFAIEWHCLARLYSVAKSTMMVTI